MALKALPDELKLMICEFLGPVESTCLGLTCKIFYSIHRSLQGTVKLMKLGGSEEAPKHLHEFLTAWMGPELKWYGAWISPQFLTREQFIAVRKRWELEWRRSNVRVSRTR